MTYYADLYHRLFSHPRWRAVTADEIPRERAFVRECRILEVVRA